MSTNSSFDEITPSIVCENKPEEMAIIQPKLPSRTTPTQRIQADNLKSVSKDPDDLFSTTHLSKEVNRVIKGLGLRHIPAIIQHFDHLISLLEENMTDSRICFHKFWNDTDNEQVVLAFTSLLSLVRRFSLYP